MPNRFRQLLISLAIFTTAAFAQSDGRLTGTVLDPSGAAVHGAKVSLSLPGSPAVLLEAETTDAGVFALSGVRPDFYDLSVQQTGFRKYNQKNVKVDTAAETVLSTIRLELGSVTETVDVQDQTPAVQVNNAEIVHTVTADQVRMLPQLDRLVGSLFNTQAGVFVGRDNAVVNGQRSTFTSVTIEGININDNLFRESSIGFQPNLLSLEEVNEVSVTTSNANASVGGGASQVTLTTRAGTDQFHGALYAYNRNNAAAAGNWFDDFDGLPKSRLNQNQIGGSIGGPILRNKLLFYSNYEAFRDREQSALTRTILTADARNGIFTYRDTSGAVKKVNVLTAAGISMDPASQQLLAAVPGADKINNIRAGDSTATLLRNSGGYSFQARDNRDRDNVLTRLDYYLSPRHILSGSYLWNRDNLDRPDLGNNYTVAPAVQSVESRNLVSAGWRWNPSGSFTNDLRGGANVGPIAFTSNQQFGTYLIDAAFMRNAALLSNPVNTFRTQGRDTNTGNFSDTAGYLRGRHNFQFGFQMQRVTAIPYNEANITPRYDLAIGTGNQGLTSAQLPGISTTDLANANNLLALLGGYVDGFNQLYNVTSPTSGFVPNTPDRRTWKLNNYAWFGQDTWKLHRRLTLTLGLRYELFGVVNEADGLSLLPRLENNNAIASVLDPNNSLDFAGGPNGRPYYNRDRNDFAPNLGLAWDVFGDGRTAIRSGYSINYVNDNQIAAIRNVAAGNSGLAQTVTRTGLTGRLTSSLPVVPSPTYKVPRAFADNYALDTTAAFSLVEPNLRTPYVQQWNFGIQQKIKGNVLEVRYVGNHGVKLLRSIDYNQVIIRENGFLDDFLHAYNNGNLSLASTGKFDPRYNAAVPGSQQLTLFPQLPSGGNLTNSTVIGQIQRGEVGDLANSYQAGRTNGPISFYRNYNAQANNVIGNGARSSFHALQVDFVRRMRNGVQIQANYSFSKVLSDSLGDNQNRLEPLLDVNNGSLERARAPFDMRHQFKANGVWTLPFGQGHRLANSHLNWLVGGWAMSGVVTWQSGTPFSVLSGRGTLNRTNRSTFTNTANSPLNGSQLGDITGFFMTADGPMFIDPSVIGPDGRPLASAFTNPVPGSVGGLQRRMFSGPSAFDLDASVLKTIKIGERQSLEIRAEAFNLPNHPTFAVGDETVSTQRTRFDINQPVFGTINSMLFDRRVLQFGAYYRF